MTTVGNYYRPALQTSLRSFGALGATFRATGVDVGIESLQTQLARLGFLIDERSPQGIDARWGSRTELALRFAAKYVGLNQYYDSPIRPSGDVVEIPQDLLDAIQTASPAGAGTPGYVGPDTGDGETVVEGFGMGTLALVAAGALLVGFLVFRKPEPKPFKFDDSEFLKYPKMTYRG
jgi:hypothetical protein